MNPLQTDARLQRVRRLSEIARKLTYALTEEEIVGVTLKETCGLLGTDRVVLLSTNSDGALSAQAGPALRLRAQKALSEGFAALDEAAIERVRALLDTGEESRFVAVPLVVAGEVAGVLAAAHETDGEDREWLLSAVADQAAVSLEKLRLNEAALAAGRAQREREEQFRALFASPLIGLVLKDTDGLVLDANDAFLAMTGYPAETVETQTLTWDAFAKPRGSPSSSRPAASPPSSRPYEAELVRRDGQRVDVVMGTANLDRQGKQLVFAVDISAQKRAETSLRILSETSKALLGASLDYHALFRSIAWLVVPRFADWCAVESIDDTGRVGEHVVLENLSSSDVDDALEWRRCYPPDPRARGGVAEVLRTAKSQLHPHVSDDFLAEYVCEASPQASELSKLRLRSAVLVPVLLHGKVVGVITFVRTALRRRYGPEDVALAEEIARRAAFAIENTRLYIRAQEAIGLRDDFLAVAAHELKTPLTTLQLQVDALGRQVESACPNDAKAARRIASVERQLGRLTMLVASLLDVSRISAGRMVLSRETFDLREVIRTVLEQVHGRAGKTNTPLVAELPDPILGSWDRARLAQGIGNVVSNALKYGAGAPVEISLRAKSGSARLSIRDHGIGIAPKDLRRIFNRFERAVPTQNYGGLGLGLFLAREIVEAHGGSIRVSSLPGEGTEFVVELPTHARIAVQPEASP